MIQKPATRKSNPREVAMDILTRVEEDKSYSNLLVNKALQKAGMERADSALTTELVYGTIQRLNTIDHYLGRFAAKGLDKLQPWVRNLLRLSFYQLYYLQRIPPHAAVNEAVNLAKKRGHQGISGMVNGILRNVLRQKETLTLPAGLNPVQRIALGHSHPEWLVARWVRAYGADLAERMCAANNEPPHASVRVNAMRRTRGELLERMRGDGVTVRPSLLAPAGLVAEGAGNLAHSAWYAAGELSVQDESSMLVGEVVAPEPRMRVLDCCAAPGGKTAHMAERMAGHGTITACDVHEHKRQLIVDQAERLGLTDCVRPVVADARKLSGLYPPESFDRILLDAPCSGLGVIRRKPDLKWAKEELEIADIATLQKELLEAVHKLLKPGGVLVYSTCTTEREENQAQVEAFLREHQEFSLEPFPESPLETGMQTDAADKDAISTARRDQTRKEAEGGMVQILPCDWGTDGFFIARLHKSGQPAAEMGSDV
nr:16S rRNA (cytosine(967)-C(5))-methyltransferase RsmB [Gorillibacterium massiliense]